MGRIYYDMSEGHSGYLTIRNIAIRPRGNTQLER